MVQKRDRGVFKETLYQATKAGTEMTIARTDSAGCGLRLEFCQFYGIHFSVCINRVETV
jgi:hypothetical protein